MHLKRPPTLLLDESLSSRTILDGLAARAIPARPLSDLVARGAGDADVFAAVARRHGLRLLLRDAELHLKSTVRAELRAARAGVFVITAAGPRTAEALVGLVARAWPQLVRFHADHRKPYIARILGNGRVERE